jgi:hypothetical protein
MPATPAAPLVALLLSSGKNDSHVFWTWRFDRSDQKYQNSRAVLSLGGVRLKQAVVHLFTMSKDPAGTIP